MTYTPKQERNQGEGALNVATHAPRSDAALTGPAEGLAGITQYATGLLIHAPLSAERQAIIAREAEKEAKAAAFEAEQRRQAALERKWELERQGVVPHSVADVLARASYGMDRADKAEERREREAAEQLGRPEPRVTRWELKREQQQREADAIIEPASKADVSKLSATVSQLKSKLHSLSGRSEQVSPGTARRAESPEEYAQNYGDSSVRFRNGGGIIGGPY